MNPIESSHSSTDLTSAIIDFLNFILILTPPILPLGFAVCVWLGSFKSPPQSSSSVMLLLLCCCCCLRRYLPLGFRSLFRDEARTRCFALRATSSLGSCDNESHASKFRHSSTSAKHRFPWQRIFFHAFTSIVSQRLDARFGISMTHFKGPSFILSPRLFLSSIHLEKRHC